MIESGAWEEEILKRDTQIDKEGREKKSDRQRVREWLEEEGYLGKECQREQIAVATAEIGADGRERQG